ncbi:hypothetical protein ACFU76_19585 [Streptomyces sp. NPDC057539]
MNITVIGRGNIGGGPADGEGVQHQLRLSLQVDRRRPCTAEQPVVR